MASYITIEEVRHYLMDRSVEDNDLDLDLSFSDDEITKAMERAARAFNSVLPLITMVEADKLPADTNIFLDATAEQLYIAMSAKLRRNDIDYTAGGVTTNLVAKRIAHLMTMAKECRERWEPTARDIKIARNVMRAYRMNM